VGRNPKSKSSQFRSDTEKKTLQEGKQGIPEKGNTPRNKMCFGMKEDIREGVIHLSGKIRPKEFRTLCLWATRRNVGGRGPDRAGVGARYS